MITAVSCGKTPIFGRKSDVKSWKIFYSHKKSGVIFGDITVPADSAVEAYGVAKYRILSGDGQYRVIGIFRVDPKVRIEISTEG
jgi:hypothetical protein